MQQSNLRNRPPPAPIFNHKKRQRQAMFVDPQTSDGPSSSASGPNLMPVCGFKNRNIGNQMDCSKNFQSSSNYAGNNQKFIYNNSVFKQQNNQNENGRIEIQRSNQNNKPQNSWNQLGMKGSYQPGPPHTSVKRAWQNQRDSENYLNPEKMGDVCDYNMNDSFGNNSSKQFQQTQNRALLYNNQGQRVVIKGGINNSSSGGKMKPSNTSIKNTWGGGPTHKGPICQTSQCNKDHFSPKQPADLRMKQNVQLPTFSGKEISSQCKKVKTDDVDRSLKVLTLSTTNINKWHQINNQLCPVLFEVFGIIDSAVLRDNTGTGKQFLLRDEEDKLQCVFYEIDRELPRLIRGQWHRCVGSVDSQSGILKCVSVRPAANEERQMAKSSKQACEKSLMNLIQQSREQ